MDKYNGTRAQRTRSHAWGCEGVRLDHWPSNPPPSAICPSGGKKETAPTPNTQRAGERAPLPGALEPESEPLGGLTLRPGRARAFAPPARNRTSVGRLGQPFASEL